MKRFLENTGLMPKIVTTIALLALVSIALLGFSAFRVLQTDERYSFIVDSKQVATFRLIRANRFASEITLNAYRAITYDSASPLGARARAGIDESKNSALTSLREAVEAQPELAATSADYAARIERIHDQSREGADAMQAGNVAAARQFIARANQELEALTTTMVAYNNARQEAALEESQALSAKTTSTLIWSLVIGILVSLGAAAFGYFVAKAGIVGPLFQVENALRRVADGQTDLEVQGKDRGDEIGSMARAVSVLRDATKERVRLEEEKQRSQAEQQKVVGEVGKHLDLLAAGDLTAEIREEFPPSYRQLKDSFNSALANLGELIGSVTNSATEIRTGSQEIAQASEDLARRTESNAASLEETSAAIVQMDGRLKATASAAGETVGRADQAIATVTGGREVADEAVQAMNRVSESAKGIDSVIEGLDKIAFQTRVLAMNAAVEAGRAGEAGRGFAVVADLVSALAMRAEEEAKRARDQLTVTQTDIVTAVGAVEKVDAALQNISADVGEVHQLLGTMASDNQAQALAITEINAAIASMDQSTQQNAAMVEETSAAARNLLGEVTTLAEQSSRFRCHGQGAAAGASRRSELAVPRRGKEGAYRSPVKPLGAAAVQALVRPDADDWKEF